MVLDSNGPDYTYHDIMQAVKLISVDAKTRLALLDPKFMKIHKSTPSYVFVHLVDNYLYI